MITFTVITCQPWAYCSIRLLLLLYAILAGAATMDANFNDVEPMEPMQGAHTSWAAAGRGAGAEVHTKWRRSALRGDSDLPPLPFVNLAPPPPHSDAIAGLRAGSGTARGEVRQRLELQEPHQQGIAALACAWL